MSKRKTHNPKKKFKKQVTTSPVVSGNQIPPNLIQSFRDFSPL